MFVKENNINDIEKVLANDEEAEIYFSSSWLGMCFVNVYGRMWNNGKCTVQAVLFMHNVPYSYMLPMQVFRQFVEIANKDGAGHAYHTIIRGKYRGERLG